MLYQIKEHEQLIDSLVTPAPATTSDGKMDDATVTQSTDPWTRLGARPKSLVSSMLCPTEPWVVTGGGFLLSPSAPGPPTE